MERRIARYYLIPVRISFPVLSSNRKLPTGAKLSRPLIGRSILTRGRDAFLALPLYRFFDVFFRLVLFRLVLRFVPRLLLLGFFELFLRDLFELFLRDLLESGYFDSI